TAVSAANQLSYPIEPPPGAGFVPVADGVYWLRMPLPFGLNHINLWALEDEGGWTLVDTGVDTPESADVWKGWCAGLLGDRSVRLIICTPMPPDHVCMAGWLSRKFACPLWMTRLEYLTCRVLVADTGRNAPPEALHFYRSLGWDEGAIAQYESRFGLFGELV